MSGTPVARLGAALLAIAGLAAGCGPPSDGPAGGLAAVGRAADADGRSSDGAAGGAGQAVAPATEARGGQATAAAPAKTSPTTGGTAASAPKASSTTGASTASSTQAPAGPAATAAPATAPLPAPVTTAPAVAPDGSRASPPAAHAVTSASSVRMARGTSCWRQPDGRRLCSDTPRGGVATSTTPLVVPVGTAIRVDGDFAGLAQAAGSVRAIGDTPLLDDPDGQVWEAGATAQSFDGLQLTVSAPAGRYVLSVTLSFPEGSATYGVVLQVG